MKLKIRVEVKDAIIFTLFAILLLYLVAIAILNLSNFATYGSFYGLNPIEAFSEKFITTTFAFYIIALIALFIVTGTYFFDLEEGLGISIGSKKEKGYSRWSKPSEMKKQLKMIHPRDDNTGVGGIALLNDGKEIWVDNGEYHNLVIGATGSGKTTAVIFPMVRILAKNNESMIITDPKGEIYKKMSTMLRNKGYNITVLNFRNPQNGNAWNPLTLPYELYKNGNQDKSIELLDDLALNILYDESNKNADPFWEKTSADYFSGIALGLFEDADPSQININSISLVTTLGEEKYGGSTYIKEYFNGKDPAGAAYVNASSTIMAPSETKSSILSVFKQKIKLFASRENISEMLSYSDFKMADIGKKKSAVFLIIQDEKRTYHPLATIFVKQCYETLIDVAQENGGKLPVRTNFVLDEFANMPPLKDITTMITAARSRLVRFTMIIQNFAQLNEVYGKENAETIKGNCGNMLYLISTELAALEEISKMCGEVKSKEKDKTASTPLVTVTDLQKLKLNEVIIRRLRMSPFKTKLTPEYEMNWGKVYKEGILPTREKHSINIFDIREFVKDKKKSKMNDLFGSDDSSGQSKMPPFFGNPMLMDDKQNNNDEFNIDDLIKKIDDKIAKLEAEENMGNASTDIDSKLPEIDLNKPKEDNEIPSVNNEIKEEVSDFKTPISDNHINPKSERVVIDSSYNSFMPSNSMNELDEYFSKATIKPIIEDSNPNDLQNEIQSLNVTNNENQVINSDNEESINEIEQNINELDEKNDSSETIMPESIELPNNNVSGNIKSIHELLENDYGDIEQHEEVKVTPIIEEPKNEEVTNITPLNEVERKEVFNNLQQLSIDEAKNKTNNWFQNNTAPFNNNILNKNTNGTMTLDSDNIFKVKDTDTKTPVNSNQEITQSVENISSNDTVPTSDSVKEEDEVYTDITDDQFFDDFYDEEV